jgi:hypothetical protein
VIVAVRLGAIMSLRALSALFRIILGLGAFLFSRVLIMLISSSVVTVALTSNLSNPSLLLMSLVSAALLGRKNFAARMSAFVLLSFEASSIWDL